MHYRLVPVQSGSTVYLITKEKQLYALGALREKQCKAYGDEDHSQTVYEAVDLWPNMKHVEAQAREHSGRVHNVRYQNR